MLSSSRPCRVPRSLASLGGALLSLATIAPAGAGVPFDAAACGPRMATAPISPLPVGTGPCRGVRPGAYVRAPQGGCTLNFLFRVREKTAAGTRTVRYAGTAGHCALSSRGEVSWTINQGPRAYLSSRARRKKIGEFVYAVLRPRGVIGAYRDFALIRLDAAVKSRARMCHFGGPTGINADIHNRPTVLHHYGQGLGVGETVPARTSMARGLSDRNVAGATGAINYGDSGSGVISDDGRAVGVIVQFVDQSGPDVIGITRLRPQIERAAKVLDVRISLIKAPLKQTL
jgi:hypothetical protein